MVRNVINFPVRTYIDFETTNTNVVSGKPVRDGQLIKVSVDPAYVLTDGQKPELEAFVRRFRQWKWKGSKHVVVPVARAPVDPAHITYNSNQPTVDPFDLMLFHAYKRWKNNFQTIPGTDVQSVTGFPERFFLMDVTWRKVSIFKPFSMFTRPYVSNIGQMMQTSHFKIGPYGSGGGTGGDFDPAGLRAESAEQAYETGNGQPRTMEMVSTETGYRIGDDFASTTNVSNVDDHRHNMYQMNDGSLDYGSGMLNCTIEPKNSLGERIVEGVKCALTGENAMTPNRIRFYNRGVCRANYNEAPGIDQANLTGFVNSDDPAAPESSPTEWPDLSTTTDHFHSITFDSTVQDALAIGHSHMISDETIQNLQSHHRHPINAQHLAADLRFTYTPPNIPPQSMPWFTTSDSSYIWGRRPARGWVDTRQVSMVTGDLTDHIYSPTWPSFLWRLPKHFHTKYVFRMWITHYFALRSPIIHELFTSPTDILTGMYQEEGIDASRLTIRTPSAAAGIEAVSDADKPIIESFLARADEELAIPTVEPTE